MRILRQANRGKRRTQEGNKAAGPISVLMQAAPDVIYSYTVPIKFPDGQVRRTKDAPSGLPSPRLNALASIPSTLSTTDGPSRRRHGLLRAPNHHYKVQGLQCGTIEIEIEIEIEGVLVRVWPPLAVRRRGRTGLVGLERDGRIALVKELEPCAL